MNQLDTEGKSASYRPGPGSATTRLTGPWLLIARSLWVALVVPSIALFVISVPAYYQQLQKGCADPLTCSIAGALPTHVLSNIGFPVSWYAAFLTIFFVIIQTVWYGVGLLIFLRRSDDWLALLAAFCLVMFNGAGALAVPSPSLILPLSLVSFLGDVSLGAFFLFFPNGRLIPRWTGLALLFVIINAFVNDLPSKGSPFDENWPGWIYLLLALVIYGGIIVSQIYRYRRVSTPLQRQQTQWIVLGATMTAIFYLALLVITILFPPLDSSILLNQVWSLIFPVVELLIPLSIGFSIMRYRLYDIDVLINRTLVYGALTVLLALVYFGLVISLQGLVRLFTGQVLQSSPIVIVASTLAIATLFQPLRQRIQAIIDRRFYRRKYDAAKTLAAFSTTLHNEFDLNQLSNHLLTVIHETMQPTHASIWLRSPKPNHRQTNHAPPP